MRKVPAQNCLADIPKFLSSPIEDLEKLNLDIPVWIVLFTNKALSNLRGVPLAQAQALPIK